MKTACLICLLALLAPFAWAQKQPKQKLNREIQKIAAEINARNIETTIRKLVSFGTRNTLSEQDNPPCGAGESLERTGRAFLY